MIRKLKSGEYRLYRAKLIRAPDVAETWGRSVRVPLPKNTSGRFSFSNGGDELGPPSPRLRRGYGETDFAYQDARLGPASPKGSPRRSSRRRRERSLAGWTGLEIY